VKRAFLGSRLLVFAAALVGAHAFRFGIGGRNVDPAIVHPFGSWPLGGVLDWLVSPLIRWDATST
jgi:hypothetical protein